MRQGLSITPQLSCVHDHARLRKNLAGHWRTGHGRMTATQTFELQKIQKLLKTHIWLSYIIFNDQKPLNGSKNKVLSLGRSDQRERDASQMQKCFLCFEKVNLIASGVHLGNQHQAKDPAHVRGLSIGKPALAFRFSLLPLQRTCANGRWLRSPWNLETFLNLN